jgi:hypothetical protein
VALESVEDRLRAQHLHARSRELDPEGQAVEAAADVDDRPRVLVGDRETGRDRTGPLDEQCDRLELAERAEGGQPAWVRDVERRDR